MTKRTTWDVCFKYCKWPKLTLLPVFRSIQMGFTFLHRHRMDSWVLFDLRKIVSYSLIRCASYLGRYKLGCHWTQLGVGYGSDFRTKRTNVRCTAYFQKAAKLHEESTKQGISFSIFFFLIRFQLCYSYMFLFCAWLFELCFREAGKLENPANTFRKPRKSLLSLF